MRRRFLEFSKEWKELFVLHHLVSSPRVTQREVAEEIKVSPTMVNNYLAALEAQGLIEKEPVDGRSFKYQLTPRGSEHYRQTMVEYLRELFRLFSASKEMMARELQKFYQCGLKKVVFYSAGEVTALLLDCLEETDLHLLAIVDDDPQKQHRRFHGYEVISRDELANLDFDAVIITTYRYREEIRAQLLAEGFAAQKIHEF